MIKPALVKSKGRSIPIRTLQKKFYEVNGSISVDQQFFVKSPGEFPLTTSFEYYVKPYHHTFMSNPSSQILLLTILAGI